MLLLRSSFGPCRVLVARHKRWSRLRRAGRCRTARVNKKEYDLVVVADIVVAVVVVYTDCITVYYVRQCVDSTAEELSIISTDLSCRGGQSGQSLTQRNNEYVYSPRR